ncbi:FecR family protein [Solimonas marina]|uniref:DUF4880 domain-containing protein n=1 Tax=Solimonas marina TaxID=2714601 RepID=A0A970B4M8_9GAMM|nr:FecR domain-containing protein [Solimonas marina]NKF20798.1 DUF4880 domain-containing protein [Solimonas marina]
MSNNVAMVGRNGKPSIDEVAADWVARLDRGSLNAEQSADLEAWLAADARHFGAYARARAVFASFDRAPALGPQFDPAQFLQANEPRDEVLDSSRRRFVVGGALAAGLVLGGGVGFAAWRDGRYSTAIGEVRRVPLADGSVVTLNTATRIKVAFSSAVRRVELLQGEAMFDVSRRAGIPLQVVIGAVSLLAGEAKFNVRSERSRGVNLLVSSGRVDVYPGGGRQDVRVPADVEMQIGGVGDLQRQPVGPAQAERKLAWRDGMIAFQGETLAQAATEFARYSRQHIVIDDPGVASRTVTGLFSATNPAGFARAVATSYDLHLKITSDAVLLSAA